MSTFVGGKGFSKNFSSNHIKIQSTVKRTCPTILVLVEFHSGHWPTVYRIIHIYFYVHDFYFHEDGQIRTIGCILSLTMILFS